MAYTQKRLPQLCDEIIFKICSEYTHRKLLWNWKKSRSFNKKESFRTVICFLCHYTIHVKTKMRVRVRVWSCVTDQTCLCSQPSPTLSGRDCYPTQSKSYFYLCVSSFSMSLQEPCCNKILAAQKEQL